MKNFTRGIALLCFCAVTLFGCQPDKVNPEDQSAGVPKIAGALGDPHPKLDTTCQFSDTLFLRSEDGSPVVNKCYQFGQPIQCAPGQMPWGYLIMREGYFQDTNYVDCDFSMAPGWYCDFDHWQFALAGSFIFDNNGLPIVGTDWGSQVVNPVQNKWQLRLRVPDLPSPCFEVALRVNTVKLNLFGFVVPGSTTLTWGYNRNWNVLGHPSASESPYLLSFCPIRCMETSPPPPMDSTTFCKVVYRTANSTCTGNNLNCTTLHPTPSDAGVIRYNWSNGSHSQDLTVCPTNNNDIIRYVTIVVNNVQRHVYKYVVKVQDVTCTAESPIVALDFCTNYLNLRFNQTFNIRNYLRFYNGGIITGNQWNQVRFTYTDAGANSPTIPANWNLNAFNAGSNVTVTANDYLAGTGNVARGQYKLFVYREGRATFDDYIIIRVNNSQVSTLTSAQCANIVGGPVCTAPTGSNGGQPVPGIQVCNTPPGNPGGASTICVVASNINSYVAGTCVGTGTGLSGAVLGACGVNPCN